MGTARVMEVLPGIGVELARVGEYAPRSER